MGTVADGTPRERRAVRYLRVPGGNHPVTQAAAQTMRTESALLTILQRSIAFLVHFPSSCCDIILRGNIVFSYITPA